MSPPGAAKGTLSRTTCVALHVAVAAVFLVLSALRWAHAERKWTYPEGHIARNSELATDILAVFAALSAAVFLTHRPAPNQQQRPILHAALPALYVACVVVLVATAPRILAFGPGLRPGVVPGPPSAPRPLTLADRAILRHDRYGANVGLPVFNFYATSQIRQLAYFGEDQAALVATPGLVGNIVHDVGALKALEETPTGFFNASATQFSVSCAAPSNVRASSTDVPLAADPSNGPYSTVRVSLDIPGRGTVTLEDIAYYGDGGEPFGSVFDKGAHAIEYEGHRARGSQYIRFPRVFNASAPSTFRDNTIYGVGYDRTAEQSGVDDDLSNTIFFYMFQLLAKGDPPDTESAVIVIRDQHGQNGSRVDVSTAEGSSLADGAALFKVQAVACTMAATTFNTTVAHADNSADLSPAPVSPAARLARSSSWEAFQPRTASQNTFEHDWATIFTPHSAPQASVRFDNYSAIPGFEPLNTLESYMSSVIWGSPQLATLESALENITALAYWGLMQEFGEVYFETGPPPGLPVGVIQFKDGHLFASLASSIILLLAVLGRPR